MKTRSSCGLVFLILGLMLATNAIQAAQAQTYKVLFTFDIADGLNPVGGLVRDSAGNLYGTTFFGGTYTNGVAFKLTKSGKESTLFNFNGGSEGGFPNSSLILDQAGTFTVLPSRVLTAAGCFSSLVRRARKRCCITSGAASAIGLEGRREHC